MAVSPGYISLCSGIGGLDLGVRAALPGARCVCYVEREVTAAAVLAARMEGGALDDAPVWSDLRTFDAAAWRGAAGGVIGGIPCQPFSTAGKRRGAADGRDLWPDAIRAVRDSGASWAFFENVPGMANKSVDWYYHRAVRPRLQEVGFEVEEGLFTAAELGAPHLRERLFILAHRDGAIGHLLEWAAGPKPARSGRALAKPDGERSDRDGDAGPRGRLEPAVSRGTMADASGGERVGLRASQATGPGHTDRAAFASAGRVVADAHDGAGSPQQRVEQGERADGPGRRGRGLGDAGRAGLQAGRPAAARLALFGRNGAVWPPGYCSLWKDGRQHQPGECSACDGWAAVYAVRPDLAPATVEPGIRGMADGLPRGLARTDKLRLLGNAAVPAVAAFALRSLIAQAAKGGTRE